MAYQTLFPHTDYCAPEAYRMRNQNGCSALFLGFLKVGISACIMILSKVYDKARP